MSELGRYRRVYTKSWDDPRRRKLSQPQPCGAWLLHYLSTCPSTTSVPGLFRAGRGQLADELGWSLEDFDKAFAEVFREGFAEADWTARVVWLPGIAAENPPASPNVIRGWETSIVEVPDCALKAKAIQELHAFVEGMGKGFQKAFDEICGKPSPNQEQDQEQEQKQDQEQESHARAPASAPEDGPKILVSVSGPDSDLEAHQARRGAAFMLDALGKKCSPDSPDQRSWLASIGAFSPRDLRIACVTLQNDPNPEKNKFCTLKHVATNLKEFYSQGRIPGRQRDHVGPGIASAPVSRHSSIERDAENNPSWAQGAE